MVNDKCRSEVSSPVSRNIRRVRVPNPPVFLSSHDIYVGVGIAHKIPGFSRIFSTSFGLKPIISSVYLHHDLKAVAIQEDGFPSPR